MNPKEQVKLLLSEYFTIITNINSLDEHLKENPLDEHFIEKVEQLDQAASSKLAQAKHLLEVDNEEFQLILNVARQNNEKVSNILIEIEKQIEYGDCYRHSFIKDVLSACYENHNYKDIFTGHREIPQVYQLDFFGIKSEWTENVPGRNSDGSRYYGDCYLIF
jgi:membrane-associated HD superfamily phosphohydrolase